MKNTFLVNKVNESGKTVLSEVTAAEWADILADNRRRPKDQRRYFIADCIGEGEDMDRMFIEVSREEHHRWNSRHTVSERNRKYGNQYTCISLDTMLLHTDELHVGDTLADPICIEDEIVAKMQIAELEDALRAWKPWAMDLYKAYLSGRKKSCTEDIAKKYCVSCRTVRTYRNQFEKFVKEYLS